MPEPLWIYLMALLYFTNITTCSAIADAFDSASHDQLTRMLQGTWSGHTLLNLALRALCTVAGGYLILDDTVVEKPYARLLGEAAWVWSSKQRNRVRGLGRLVGLDGRAGPYPTGVSALAQRGTVEVRPRPGVVELCAEPATLQAPVCPV